MDTPSSLSVSHFSYGIPEESTLRGGRDNATDERHGVRRRFQLFVIRDIGKLHVDLVQLHIVRVVGIFRQFHDLDIVVLLVGEGRQARAWCPRQG